MKVIWLRSKIIYKKENAVAASQLNVANTIGALGIKTN